MSIKIVVVGLIRFKSHYKGYLKYSFVDKNSNLIIMKLKQYSIKL